eukprot:4903541-Pyramimonas_sp.AAC.1
MMNDKAFHMQYPPPARLQRRTAVVGLWAKARGVTISATYSTPYKGCKNNGTISKDEMGRGEVWRH